ncbi:5-oxoprolinase (ATP-hydrolysing) [Talaromyces islandicus]|uniref:5-oxoprolinase (ATP-hydrolysing) n=1 Tax=Talaromyces islandicus TaxID=28573 RepID=A0A0U1M2X2_TALIS|nr:5-oxoprolinase (ATP-hydrolysing) [Talaromyces islandicus]
MSSLGEAAAAWRDCTTPKEFCEKFQLQPDIESFMNAMQQPFEPLSSTLLEHMTSYFAIVKTFTEVKDLPLDLEYLKKTSNPNHQDTLIKILVSCLQETGQLFPTSSRAGVLVNVLKKHMPRRKSLADRDFENAQKKVERLREVFHTQEKGKANVSEALWEKIYSYYSQYSPSVYFSPYTSIVGPSGIGKSFSIQSIARKGLAYVVYASLSPPQASSYPGPSYLTGYLTSNETSYSPDDRARMTTQYETFIAASIRQVQLCCQHGISPSDYFTMQVYDDAKHREIHRALLAALQSLLRRAEITSGVKRVKLGSNRKRDFKSDEHRDSFDHGQYIDDEMAEYEKEIEPIFKEYAQGLKYGGIPHAAKGKPYVLFCLDEARALLNPSDLAFLSFRRAARHQQIQAQLRGMQEKESFFFVLLDTCAKFNVFVPPRGLDPSAKLTHDPPEQFTPIWEISSYDSLAIGPHTIKNLSIIKIDHEWTKRLFTFGRPNWAIQLQIGGIQGLIDHAMMKVYGGSNKKELSEEALTSLLSFRLQFYIVSHHLGESLVSGYLRMIYDMSDYRRKLRTIQPSEPILSWVACKEMATRPGCRLDVLKNFHKQCSSGSIDAGDIGEMAAALILMFAFDKKQSLDLATPKPQTVLEFVRTLFGDSNTANLSSEPTGEHVTQLMTNGFVFFNHFTRLEGPVNLTVLRQAWGRGTALFSYPGTAYFDIIIPIAILQNNNMSFIVIQVKNRQGDRLTGGLKEEADFTISRAAQALPKTSAYMGILMALRTDQKPQVNIVAEPSNSDRKKRTSSNDNKKRVKVVAVGLDHNIYPGMASKSDESKEIFILRQFSIRTGSGGKGQFNGGDGSVRHLEFIVPLSVSMLSERRVTHPYGMAGGEAGQPGLKLYIKKEVDGSERTINIRGKMELDVKPGERIIIHTPGGGT